MTKYFKQIFKLFLPLFIARIGMFFLSFVDSVMLGYSDSEHVGLQSIGDAPITLILLMLNGLLQGTLFTTAQAFGKQDFSAVGQSLRSALRYGLYLSFITIPCFIFAPSLMSIFNYSIEQALRASEVTRVLCLSIPFSIMFFICTSFLNGVKKTWIITGFVVLANVVNVFLDWVLINGLGGFPRLLSVGAAWATSIVRMFMGGGLLLYVLLHPEFKKFQIWEDKDGGDIDKKQKKIGLSATSNMLSYEIGASFCLFYAANINVIQASAYTLAYRVFILSNIIGSCFAVAGIVLSGKYISDGSKELNKVYNTSILLNMITMFLLCMVCFLGASDISFLMTSDVELSLLTIPLLKIACIAMFMRSLNSMQIIFLRNAGYLFIPSLLYNFCFLFLIPLFCIWWGKLLSVQGVMWALTVGNICAVVVLHFLLMKKI